MMRTTDRMRAEGAAAGIFRGWETLWAVLGGWLERRRQRRALRDLDDHLLRDIGIDRSDALREGRKPFWR